MKRKLLLKLQQEGLESMGKFYAIYPGKVVDNDDPEKRGRLKILIPALYGEQPFDEWVFGGMAINGDQRGIQTIPSVDSLILVQFLAGDPAHPVWTCANQFDAEIPDVFKEEYTERLNIKDNALMIELDKGSIEVDKTGKIIIKGTSDIEVQTSIGRFEIKNGAVNLGPLMDAFLNVLKSLLVQLGPAGTPLRPESIAALELIRIQFSLLYK